VFVAEMGTNQGGVELERTLRQGGRIARDGARQWPRLVESMGGDDA
jgi:hypothetical protein